jgi:hypothetical protein
MFSPSSDIVAPLSLGPYSIDAFRFCPMSLSKRSSFLGSWYSLVLGPIFPSSLFNHQSCMTVSLIPCHSCTAGHPSAVGGQLLPGPTITLGPFLQLSVAPYGQTQVSVLLLQCSDSFHCGPFFRDFLLLHYRLYLFWI